MSTAPPLRSLFEPTSVAVVGASPDMQKPGGRCLTFLRSFGYRLAVHAINPRYESIGGQPCYPDIESLPASAELVVLLMGAAQVPEYIRRCGRAGVQAVVVGASGFAEAGPMGESLQAELIEAASEAGVAMLGPNSLGLVNQANGLTATFSTALSIDFEMKPGSAAFISQSGALGAAIFALAQMQGHGFGMFVSTGNEATLDFATFLDYLADDPTISMILGYMEGTRNGLALVRAGRHARAAGKMVVVLKAGRSDVGSRAATSHTGALAGNTEAYEAAFRRAGIVAVSSARELLDLAALPAAPRQRGPHVGIVSMSGGAGVMMADRCALHGLVVPTFARSTQTALAEALPSYAAMNNPVDYGPIYVDAAAIEACIKAVASDPGVDLLLVFLGLSPGLAGVIEQRIAHIQHKADKPIVVAWLGGSAQSIQTLRGLGVAAYDDPTRAADVAAHLWHAAVPVPTLANVPVVDASIPVMLLQRLTAFCHDGRTAVTEREMKELVAAYGITVTDEILVASPGAATAAAASLGDRVAVKVETPDLAHKTDVGAVRLNVSVEAAADAYRAVIAMAQQATGKPVTAALIQTMVSPGLEMLAGCRYDAQFGPMVVVGHGGLLAEVLQDVAVELAPLTHDDATAMIRRLRIAPLFDGFRGEPPRDLEALAELLVRLSWLAVDAGSALHEVDLNPVTVFPAGLGCIVVDAAAVLGDVAQPLPRGEQFVAPRR